MITPEVFKQFPNIEHLRQVVTSMTKELGIGPNAQKRKVERLIQEGLSRTQANFFLTLVMSQPDERGRCVDY